MSALSRRCVVGGLAAGTAASGLVVLTPGSVRATVQRPLREPFTLGVASGDPLPDGFVIWTRLAPDPLVEDGLGGMPSRDVTVRWEVAADRRFRRVVSRGVTTARRRTGYAVHVEVGGLRPGREYWYRFRVGRFVSRVGASRTAPAFGASPAAVSLGLVSCSQYEHGFFTAYRRLAEERPDVVVHLGDYQYEYKAGEYVAPGDNPRDHRGPETVSLATYRQRHAQYKTDADLQEAHAVAPWVVVWDDHEVDNNWADEVPENPADERGFLRRRAAAFQAYYENMPLRRSSMPRGIDLQLYRRVQWGDLATLHMMDTRQYRDDQACGDGTSVDCAEALDPERSITGAAQEAWLLDGLASSSTTWNLLGQQVFYAPRDFTAGETESLSMDGWDGYAASRQRISDGIVERGASNPVVLTGDVHRHYANDLYQDFDSPTRPFGVELVTSSVTSGGDGSDTTESTDVQLAENPHIRFANSQRGYVMATLERDHLRADFKVLPYVQRPGAPVSTRASFVSAAGDPGLQPA